MTIVPHYLFALSINDHVDSIGYIEARNSYFGSAGTKWQMVERWRPTLQVKTRRSKFVLTLDGQLTQGRYLTGEYLSRVDNQLETLLPPGLDGTQPTLDELIDDCAWNVSTNRTYKTFDEVFKTARLFVDLNTPAVDLRIGRQAVNWGSAKFFNPTDVVPENFIAEPWRERKGVNAFKANIPVGEEGLISTLLSTNDDFNALQGAVKAGTTIQNTDIYGILYGNNSHLMIGLDIKGERKIGWWAESAMYISWDENQQHLKTSVGADYSFPVMQQLTVGLQLFHDGSGEIPTLYEWSSRTILDIADCPKYNIEVPPRGKQRQTLGRWYIMADQYLTMSNTWTMSNVVLLNVADRTGMIFPTVTYHGKAISFTGGAQMIFGKDGEFNPPSVQTTQLGIDFGDLLPTWTIQTWARYNY